MIVREKYGTVDRLKIMIRLMLLLLVVIALAIGAKGKEKQKKESTIHFFLQTALQPVGRTMYIWGGGWDAADDAAGAGATRIGVSTKWEAFAKKQRSDYDFEQHRFRREYGLDCSGFVGWVLYNTFETKDDQTGYVTTSTDMAKSMAKRGWGRLIKNAKEFLPGDIVSMEGHVWISLGTCQDGSVLLVHSSPPGVSLCGTPTKEEGQESMAIKLAREYMEKYHPDWQEKYPNREVSRSYLEQVTLFRWSQQVMHDADSMQSIKAEEIFALLCYN